MRLIRVTASAGALIALAGCSSQPTLTAEEVEAHFRQQAVAAAGSAALPDTIRCPDGATISAGQTMECRVDLADGSVLGVSFSADVFEGELSLLADLAGEAPAPTATSAAPTEPDSTARKAAPTGSDSEPGAATPAVPRPGVLEPAWSQPARTATTTGELAVLDFWDQYADYLSECRPMYPVGIEDGLGVTGANVSFGASDPNLFITLHDNGDHILQLTVVLPGDASVRYGTKLDDGPDLVFADGSELYGSKDTGGILAIAGQDCFWEFQADFRAANTYGLSLQYLRW